MQYSTKCKGLAIVAVAVILTVGGLFVAQAEEKVLVVCQAGDVAVLDNQQSTGTSKNTLIDIYDWQWVLPGTAADANGVLYSTRDFQPGIVRAWETVVHEDGTCTHTLYLREDEVFHSGNPITAADLKYAIMRRAALGRDYIHTSLGGMYGYNEDLDLHVRVVDDYTLEIDAKQPMPYFWDIWAQRTYFDSKLAQANATQDDPWALKFVAKNDCGSGPYVLESWVPGVEVQLSRFDDYWGPAPFFDRIVWSIVPDLASRILLLKTGDVDIALNIPMKETLSLANDPDIKLVSGPSASQLYIQMNANIEPFNNESLRWALTYAFPYDDIVTSIYAGNAQENYGPIPAGIEGALAERRYNTDLVKAREYLVEAGYGDGVELTLDYQVGFPEHEQIGLLFKENLKQIGIDLTLRQLPSGQYQTGTQKRSLGMFMGESLQWILTADYFMNAGFNSTSSSNFIGYKNPEFDALIIPALQEVDARKRAEMNTRMQEIILGDAAWIYICQPNFVVAMRSDIVGYVVENTQFLHVWLLSRVGGG